MKAVYYWLLVCLSATLLILIKLLSNASYSLRRLFKGLTSYLCILRTDVVFWLSRTVPGKYNQSETFSPVETAYYWRSANTLSLTPRVEPHYVILV